MRPNLTYRCDNFHPNRNFGVSDADRLRTTPACRLSRERGFEPSHRSEEASGLAEWVADRESRIAFARTRDEPARGDRLQEPRLAQQGTYSMKAPGPGVAREALPAEGRLLLGKTGIPGFCPLEHGFRARLAAREKE